MSTSAPIGIATSGLVFHYDIDNIKSYAGPAASNIASLISTTTSTSTGFSFVGGTETVYIPGLNGSVVSAYNDIQNNYSLSGNCCPAPISYGVVAASGSTTYTYSILYRSGNGYTSGNYMYRYEYNGGTYITEAGVFDDAKRIDMGNGWYWAYNTFTTNASTNFLYLYLFYYYYSSVSNRVHVAKVMVMKGDYTNLHPRYWPGLSATRSATSSVLDLSGNNTWTVNNLTYDSGSFTFNGTNSWLESSTSTVFDSNTITMESWCNPTTTAQYGFLFEKGQVNTQYSNFFADAPANFYFRTIGGTITNGDLSFTTATYVTANRWNHIVCTYNGSIKIIYVNGVQIASVAASGTLASGQTNQYVGKYGNSGNNYPFSGKIGISRVYNRALSASEVIKNYNSAKSRFGL